jgi:hypothetical protein
VEIELQTKGVCVGGEGGCSWGRRCFLDGRRACGVWGGRTFGERSGTELEQMICKTYFICLSAGRGLGHLLASAGRIRQGCRGPGWHG